MKNLTDSFVSLGHWPSAGSFGFNTDILATNPINLSVVLGVLIFFGKGVCASYSEIEREKVNLINATSYSLEQLENYKNETLHFEQQRAINQVRQQVFQQALQGALGTLNSCLNSELHFRTISANIGILGAIEEITD
uniref:ATP synthase CF0 subunit I n=1 Tax=Hippeastrum vittatum TaxID=231486 RepID=A0A7G9IXT4_HIPVI|nr:ATP synthase CF0 subunit I [Hippeastrum vittatum]QNM40178.1 ATP synthase CF0 subunit I [Hippeastrum vittatum]